MHPMRARGCVDVISVVFHRRVIVRQMCAWLPVSTAAKAPPPLECGKVFHHCIICPLGFGASNKLPSLCANGFPIDLASISFFLVARCQQLQVVLLDNLVHCCDLFIVDLESPFQGCPNSRASDLRRMCAHMYAHMHTHMHEHTLGRGQP